MTELETFLTEMKQKYPDQVVIKQTTPSKEISARSTDIPQPLQEFYARYDSLELPFGHIDPAEAAIRHSREAEPFKSGKWFCFGFDGYFSFWLCSSQADADGLWITPWDHDTDEIIECVYTTLVEFLRDMEEEYSQA